MSESMEEKLKKFESKTKPITPTSSLVDGMEKSKQKNRISDLFTSKPRMEDTHTRRTFLVRNDLLKRLDDTTNKPDNFTKTKFINYLLERGLEQLEEEN